MNILAIESSCDETAAAVVSGDPKNLDGTLKLESNVVVSQIDIFKAYGGVIPEVAARSHLEAILPVVKKALKDADKTWDDIDAIAVTHTPGLLGSLLIGTLTARTLAILHNKPLYAVHHLKSHIYANWLTNDSLPEFPLIALVISGGHTQIIKMNQHNHFDIIGTTRDDAVGECFDKVAKILGLPYPGGPAIAEKAKQGDPKKYHFPHPKLTSAPRDKNQPDNPSLDFSFSGLKTAVLRTAQEVANVPISTPSGELKNLLTDEQKADLAASFQKTAIDILLEKLGQALTENPDVKSIVIAGGVSANSELRKKVVNAFAGPGGTWQGEPERRSPMAMGRPDASPKSVQTFFPMPKFSGDNAAMVGASALYEIASGVEPTNPYSLNILPRSAIS